MPLRGLLEVVGSRIRRARFSATPAYAWRMRAGSALERSAGGRRVKRVLMPVVAHAHRPSARPDVPRSRVSRPGGRNVLFVSHCDFAGNSAYHVYSIATELERRGWSPVIAVPGSPRGARELGRAAFQVLSFRDVHRGRLRFPDEQGPDVVHAFTPREPVRLLALDVVRRYGCPYVVHLEDNEMAVRSAIATAWDPHAMRAFVDEAAGVTVVVDRLLELKPAHIPGVVVWPGYDVALDEPGRPRSAIRRDIGLDDLDVAVVYSGSVHRVNADEVGALYEAVKRLRAGGRNLVLVKSGFNTVPASLLPELGQGIRDLGWIRRRRVFELMHAADILVQPGVPGPFNDYRFPSKLPEFLASGRPVVLPQTNIGLHLRDRVEALVLERGDADEIRTNVALLASDAEFRERLGQRGREFAVRTLQWPKSVDQVIDLYRRVLEDNVAVASTRV